MGIQLINNGRTVCGHKVWIAEMKKETIRWQTNKKSRYGQLQLRLSGALLLQTYRVAAINVNMKDPA
jgi:hypothetical protein